LSTNGTRAGKIARLPLHLREELNTRLRDGQQAKKPVTWLNGLPEVRQIIIGLETLARHLDHNPEAKAAFSKVTELLTHPFDPSESAKLRPLTPSGRTPARRRRRDAPIWKYSLVFENGFLLESQVNRNDSTKP